MYRLVENLVGNAEAPSGPLTEKGPPGSETILLVEDDEGIRLLARLALEPHGYKVIAAANGDQALEIARRHLGSIHLLVTDIQVPGMRGPELAAQIAGLRPNLKVLFISGYLDNATARQEHLAPSAAILGKPFSIDALARKVRELLDS